MENKEEVIVNKSNGILSLTFNRPAKKNAWSNSTLEKIIESLERAKADPEIKIVYFTGVGDVYSAGNDLNNFVGKTFDESIQGFEVFVESFINFPKILFAGVNGMCIGIATTLLALFDFVVCSDTAFFLTPFPQTLQSPEGCSTYTFPRLLGKPVASHMLINGGSMSSSEAKALGFVSHVWEKESFQQNVEDYLSKLASNSLEILTLYKEMINSRERKILSEVHKMESKILRKRWDDPNFKNIMKKFVKSAKF
jgi:peroxisomal 3,2-trans-enoyl-CoA isomerase